MTSVLLRTGNDTKGFVWGGGWREGGRDAGGGGGGYSIRIQGYYRGSRGARCEGVKGSSLKPDEIEGCFSCVSLCPVTLKINTLHTHTPIITPPTNSFEMGAAVINSNMVTCARWTD